MSLEPVLVRVYSQCGGKDYTGPTQCRRGLKCKKVNEYWSMCVYRTKFPNPKVVPVYGQCGGVCDGAPCPADLRCAPGGLVCVEQNEYYSQCLPEASV